MTLTNTLDNTRKLEESGFPPQQARTLSEILEQTAVASQKDLKDFISGQTEILRGEIRAETEKLRGEIRAETEKLRAEFHREMRLQMFWFISVQTAIIVAVAALFKLFI